MSFLETKQDVEVRPGQALNAVAHGGWSWLARGEVPHGCEDIRAGIEQLRADLTGEYGPDLTPSQVVLVDRVCALVGFTKLAERHSWRKGPIIEESGKVSMQPVLGTHYIAFSSAAQRALLALAELSKYKPERPSLSLDSYLSAKRAEAGEPR